MTKLDVSKFHCVFFSIFSKFLWCMCIISIVWPLELGAFPSLLTTTNNVFIALCVFVIVLVSVLHIHRLCFEWNMSIMCNGCGSIEGIELGKNYDFRVHLKSREARVEPRGSWHFTPLHPPPKTFFVILCMLGKFYQQLGLLCRWCMPF
jgi:hypothetical protein